jgi:hypothetical protein
LTWADEEVTLRFAAAILPGTVADSQMRSDLIENACPEIDSRFQALSKSEAAADDQTPDCLYHYTSAEGLLGIIQSGELWATNVLYLNDASELFDANDVLRSELESQPARLRDANAQYMQLTIPARMENVPIDHFVVSFCENGDLLSQWRAYGAPGGGYSIGFHPSALQAAANRDENTIHGGCTVRKVRYKQNQKEEMIRKRIEILRAIVEPLSDQLVPESDEDFRRVNQLWAQAAASFHPALALMKHAAFEEEREWRLVRTLWKKPVPTAKRPLRLRIVRDQLTPYVPVSWALPNKPPRAEVRGIRDVCCGPSVNPDLKEKAVRDLQAAHDCWSFGVFQSKVPLRV